MKTRTLILIMILAGFALTSCQKSKPIEEASIEAADDAVFAEILFDDVFASLEIASGIAESGLKSAVVDSCPVITTTFPAEGLWPRNIVIDYGTECTGLNDVVRSGKILITMTAPRNTRGSKRTATFDNYFVNGVKIEGTKVVENLGLNNNGNVVFAVSLSDGKMSFPDGKTIEREFGREREYVAGFMTRTPWDDECLITGSATGVNLNGKSYTHTIINALSWKAACRFIVSGTVRFEVEGVEPFELDYGDGECDAYATVSRGEETREIILRFRHPKLPIR
jgi:hypothetical protein